MKLSQDDRFTSRGLEDIVPKAKRSSKKRQKGAATIAALGRSTNISWRSAAMAGYWRG